MTENVGSNSAVLERRKARRFTVDWDVVLKGKDELGSGLQELGSLRDLSSRGAFLSVPRRLKVGMRLELWIRMPSEPERWMIYGAEIVRIDQGLVMMGAAARFLSARPRIHSLSLDGS